ncbi:MAG TPA: phosphohistidine phosphatase SixA [Myxococcales bacterium]|jgi:phosphohistidine phosphatase
MLLYLMRHGLAADAAGAGPRSDAERALTAEGRVRVEKVAEALADVGVEPGLILTSPLVRARETAEIVGRQFPKAKVKTTAHLAPGSAAADLVEEAASSRAKAVLCVGHSPQLEMVVSKVCAGVEFPICELKKAGVACLDVEGYSRRGVIRWVLPPGLVRKLRRGGG